MRTPFDGGTNPPLGPLSRAMGAGDFVFVSGTIGTRDDGSLPADVAEQTTVTIDNIEAHLAAAGLGLDDIVSVTVYLVHPEDFSAMNEAYASRFSSPQPARATVCCRLVDEEHLVEISAIAYRGVAR